MAVFVGWRALERRSAARRVGGVVDAHGRIADGPGAEEELLEAAVGAAVHRPEAEAVRQDLRADAAGAVVDGEGVAGGLQRLGQTGPAVVEDREGLLRVRELVVLDGELAERLVASRHVRHGARVRIVAGMREAVAVRLRPGDDRGEVGGHELVLRVEHVQDRGVEVEERLPERAESVVALGVIDRLQQLVVLDLAAQPDPAGSTLTAPKSPAVTCAPSLG
jgi:hypothetical protein